MRLRTSEKVGILILVTTNTFILFLSFYAGLWLRSMIASWPGASQLSILLNAVLFTLFNHLIFYLFDLYNFRAKLSSFSLVPGICISIMITMSVMGISYYFLPFLPQGRGILALSGLVSIILLSSWWLFYNWAFRKLRPAQQILIVGSSETGEMVAREIISNADLGYSLLGFVDEFSTQGYTRDRGEDKSDKTWMAPTIGTVTALDQIVKDTPIDQIIVALAERRKFFPMETLLDCKLRGIKIHEATDFYEQLTGKIFVQGLKPSWLIFCQGFNKSRFEEVSKRIVDIIISVIGLIVTVPIMAVTAILIKLESSGPVIFKQDRVGKGEKLFKVYKFRSMTTDAEAKTGPVWAKNKDPRVTRVGRLIRKVRIDELPQLINILKGDMSFVGPRPERPYFVEILKKEIPYYSLRSTVKPGLTGWAQISFYYASSVEDTLEKLQYDLFYIKNQSLFFDLIIILKTIVVVLLGKGAK
jgi:sugar transferase (PEP-CTERM system associated)